MRGLLEMDYRLIMQRKQILILFLVICAMLAFTQGGSFIVGYMTMLTSLYTVSTINYDEDSNGYSFLMTLPVSRKEYVTSKYIFSFLGGMIGWIAAVALDVISLAVKGYEWSMGEELGMASVFIPLFMMVSSLLISFQLRFGSEKSRIMIMLLAGAVGGSVYVMSHIDRYGIINALMNTSGVVFVVLLYIVAAIIAIGTYCWIVNYMNRKDF